MQNLALSCTTFFLCALVLEIILRFAGYGNLEMYQPDPKLYWKLQPNQDCFTKIGHHPVHINSHGARGPEFQVPKPPGTFRILSLGDSRTFGWGLDEEQTYSRRLQSLLEQKAGVTNRIEVINAGVNAWSYSQMFVYFRDTGLSFQPDMVIVGDANLWTQFTENNRPEFVRQIMWRVRLKDLLRHFAIYDYVVEVKLEKVYARARTGFIPVKPGDDRWFPAEQRKDPDAVFYDAVAGICRLAQTNGVKPLLLYLPWANDLNATNAPASLRVKQAVHQRLGVPLVDMTPDLRSGGYSLYLEHDSVHLNAEGNELVAGRLFETVTNWLPR